MKNSRYDRVQVDAACNRGESLSGWDLNETLWLVRQR